MSVLVIDGSPGQHHGVVVGPFGCVAPPLLVAVPEVAAGRVANDAVGETLPHREGKVHLDRDRRETKRQEDMRTRNQEHIHRVETIHNSVIIQLLTRTSAACTRD